MTKRGEFMRWCGDNIETASRQHRAYLVVNAASTSSGCTISSGTFGRTIYGKQ